MLSDVRHTRMHYDDGVMAIAELTAPPGLQLSGEINESNYPALVQAFKSLTYSLEAHLDLSGVRYCDVGCLRAIIALACPDPEVSAPSVYLHGVPPFLRETLRTLGWDTLPGLHMD